MAKKENLKRVRAVVKDANDEDVTVLELKGKLKKLDEYLKKLDRKIEMDERKLRDLLDISEKDRILIETGVKLLDKKASGGHNV